MKKISLIKVILIVDKKPHTVQFLNAGNIAALLADQLPVGAWLQSIAETAR